MYLQLAAAVAVLPLLVAANPVTPRVGTVINLTKRTSLAKDGVVNIDALNAHLAHVQAYVVQL